MAEVKIGELYSFGPIKPTIGVGLLGAVGATYEQAKQERLNEIERRILAIEERLGQLDDPLGH